MRHGVQLNFSQSLKFIIKVLSFMILNFYSGFLDLLKFKLSKFTKKIHDLLTQFEKNLLNQQPHMISFILEFFATPQ